LCVKPNDITRSLSKFINHYHLQNLELHILDIALFCFSFVQAFLIIFFQTSIAREGESEENLDKTYYVYLPPELCLVHPLPGTLVRGAQRLPSIMRRVESMLLAVQLKNMINFPIPAFNVFSLSIVYHF
jgi:PAZ domain